MEPAAFLLLTDNVAIKLDILERVIFGFFVLQMYSSTQPTHPPSLHLQNVKQCSEIK